MIRASLPRVCVALVISAPAWAHHSFAMFDNNQSLTLHGTVMDFQWTNPHCFLQVLVADKYGSKEWSVEMSSPANIYRKGWRPRTLKSGDKVSVTIHPTKDGSNGGTFVSAIGPDGQALFPEKSSP